MRRAVQCSVHTTFPKRGTNMVYISGTRYEKLRRLVGRERESFLYWSDESGEGG